MTIALNFRLKLLLAFMLVVSLVTSASLYVAEGRLRANRQEELDAQFQNQVSSFLAIQEAQSSAIMERCLVLSHSVRLRAALEERDVEDLYQNALTELQGIFGSDDARTPRDPRAVRALFFRFLDKSGAILPPGIQSAGFIDQMVLESALTPLRSGFDQIDDQSAAVVAISAEPRARSLRQVVVTKIRDWDGRTLGALVLGFPIGEMQAGATADDSSIKRGIWLDRRLHMDGISRSDRQRLAEQVAAAMVSQPAGHFGVNLATGPYLLFYKALDADTKFSAAYQVCLYSIAGWQSAEQTLRWKIIALGLGVLILGFGGSILLTQRLSKPVDKILAGSAENLSLRKRAEEDLRQTNRELEKALNELKATQQQVIQQERLSAIGQMSSGIAHDFNNTLMPIIGFADLLLKNEEILGNREEARRCLEMVLTAAQDAANVVRRLREFYRPIESDEEFPVVDLVKIVQQAVALTEPKWRHQAQASGRTIEVSTDFKAMPVVAGQETALREVLTNLIFNAVDAMPEGGRILLETSVEGENAVIRVQDSGTGMTESVRQRCLEPFFSTKGERGTGLGLSMVYGIIERHRGHLDIQSSVGKGTTFILRLPLADETPKTAVFADEGSRSGSSLNVLIVDDEPRIREVVSTYLRCDGHRVATAASGREALEKFRRGNFDLVVVDRVMPEMSGEQTARFIKQINKDAPVIMLTGFGGLIEANGSEPDAIDCVLSKPITADVLRQTIDKVLHAA